MASLNCTLCGGSNAARGGPGGCRCVCVGPQDAALGAASGRGPDLTISGVGKRPSKRARPAADADDLPSRKRKAAAEPGGGGGGGGGSGQIALAADALQLPRRRLVAAAASTVAIGAPDGDAQCFKCGRTAADIMASVQAPVAVHYYIAHNQRNDSFLWPGVGPIKAVFGVWCCTRKACKTVELNTRAERPSAAWAALSLAAGADPTENRHPGSHYGRSQRVTPTSVSRCNYCAREQKSIPKNQLQGAKLAHDMCAPGTYKCRAGPKTKHGCKAKASGGRANFHERMGGPPQTLAAAVAPSAPTATAAAAAVAVAAAALELVAVKEELSVARALIRKAVAAAASAEARSAEAGNARAVAAAADQGTHSNNPYG